VQLLHGVAYRGGAQERDRPGCLRAHGGHGNQTNRLAGYSVEIDEQFK
jgi:hypothetical protein